MGEVTVVAVSPAPAADGNREGRSNENANDEGNDDQMQIDEKGSGDIWATEKVVDRVAEEDSELPEHKDLINSEQDFVKESGNMKEDENGAMEKVSETNKWKDAREKDFTSSDNTVDMIKKESENLVKSRKEVKQMSDINQMHLVSSDLTTTVETKGSRDTKRTRRSGGINNINDTNRKKETLSEESVLKDIKQKVSPGINSSTPKETKVKVANKYKTSVKTSREEASEV